MRLHCMQPTSAGLDSLSIVLQRRWWYNPFPVSILFDLFREDNRYWYTPIMHATRSIAFNFNFYHMFSIFHLSWYEFWNWIRWIFSLKLDRFSNSPTPFAIRVELPILSLYNGVKKINKERHQRKVTNSFIIVLKYPHAHVNNPVFKIFLKLFSVTF